MAKKVVADFKSDNTKKHIKLIKMIKKENGSYGFKESIIKREDLDKHLDH